MAIANSALDAANVTTTWQKLVRWIPTSEDAIIASEHRLLSLVKTPYFQEQVNIGSGPLGIKFASTEPSYINTITFDNQLESAPTLVMLHGYGASQGFFFRNFDALAKHFRVIAIDQLGWGASSRPDFTCKNTEETEAWFISSFEAWRKAKNLESFILLGHSFGGYVAAKYALMHPEHLQHLILVGSAGFSAQSDERSEGLLKFRATSKGAILSRLWESNFTFQKIVRGMGRWGPDVVKIYTNARFCSRAVGTIYNKEEPQLFSDYVYHTLAGKASGELCLKYIFAFGALARSPLLPSAADWKVSTSFIYGVDDWIDYRGAVDACMKIPVPKEIIRVPQGGHPVFLDNASGFHAAVLYSCRRFLKIQNAEDLLNGLTKVL